MKPPVPKTGGPHRKAATPTVKTTPPAARTLRAGTRRRGGKPSGGKNGSEPRMRIRAREQGVVALSEAGRTQDAIARELGITQSAVSQILRRVDLRIVAELAVQRAPYLARIFRKLDYVSREGSAGWEQSKAGHVKRTQTKRQDASGAPQVIQQVTVDERPNARLLEEVRRAEEAKAELLGFGTSADRSVTPAPTAPATILSPEELAERVAALFGDCVAEPHDVTADATTAAMPEPPDDTPATEAA
jgi:DNA-binding CsgD family transcriptional regulator